MRASTRRVFFGQAAFFALLSALSLPRVTAQDLTLTIVYDNNPYQKGLEARWGFSCLVKGPQKTILFDVGGDGSVLLRNMQKLKIDPKAVEVIVLSHIHVDHIGGLSDFLRRNNKVTVYMPQSLPKSVKHIVKRAGAELIEVRGPTEICKDVYSTGELGGWIKEQSLAIRTSRGAVIVTGCAHPGIVSITRKAKQMLHSDAYLAVGGFHLCWMRGWKIKRIVRGLRKEEVSKVAPCHCSGNLARKLFQTAYGQNFILAGVGKTIRVKDAFAPKRD
jgi:7,8-dihydropterin-6-yl-methyl-4-(beta-D-ribofuranosyl)aminobenzene 5'-phosphate synthase